jgi:DNA-binding CsgD family transcriptional regulator
MATCNCGRPSHIKGTGECQKCYSKRQYHDRKTLSKEERRALRNKSKIEASLARQEESRRIINLQVEKVNIAKVQRQSRAAEMHQMVLDGKTLQQIGQVYGMSRERVRQVLTREGYPVRATTKPKLRRGDALTPRMAAMFKVLAELDACVDRRAHDECWEWTGDISPGPERYRGNPTYQRPRIRAFDPLDSETTRLTTAYRVVYMLNKGPIPDGMTVDHLCFNPLCCNPNHLQLLTRAENSARKKKKAPANSQQQGA